MVHRDRQKPFSDSTLWCRPRTCDPQILAKSHTVLPAGCATISFSAVISRPDYLALLQFFLNHRRFLRSERERADRQEPGGTTDRRGAWPLAGATRLHPLFAQLNAPSRRFLR